MAGKAQRPGNGNFELADAASHLMRRCEQLFADLYAREAAACELTRSQFTVLCALEHNEGVSQTALVEITGIDRSTLAEMVRRMLERGLVSRKRTEADLRANAVAITPGGRKALRAARAAADRAERRMLDVLPLADRPRFIKNLQTIAAASESVTSAAEAFHRKSRRAR